MWKTPLSPAALAATAALAASALAGCGPAPTADDTQLAGGFLCAEHPGMGGAVGSLPEEADFRECLVRTQESRGGNLLADAQWWALQDGHWSAEVTRLAKEKKVRFFLENSGAAQLKAVVPAGELCATGYASKTAPGEGDLAAGKAFNEVLVPYTNQIVFVTMARSKLRQVLERSFALNETSTPAVGYPNTTGSFLMVSGNVRITVDFTDAANRAQVVRRPTTTRPGRLITSVTVDGEPVDLASEEPITFAANNFVAGIDLENGAVKPGTVAGEGAGVAAGLSSDAFGNAQLPATNSFLIVDEGRDAALPTTMTSTNVFRKYFQAHPQLVLPATGRYVYSGPVPSLERCL
jgi:hypothetical protein